MRALEYSEDKLVLSVIVPVFNELEVLPEFHRRLVVALTALPCSTEVIYVDDGSTDGSHAYLEHLAAAADVGLIAFSRNFGKEAAMTAGLDHADGSEVVIIDADLQDPPELIAALYARFMAGGVDVVYAQRRSRLGETWLKRMTARNFYRVIRGLASVEIPRDTGDFRLMSRRAVEAIKRLGERRRFMKGLFAWIGFPAAAIEYDRDPRKAGQTKWRYWKLWNFALEGVTSFTTAPLRLATYIGLVCAAVSGAYGLFIVVRTLIFGADMSGYPSLFTAILFFGGTQLFFLGIIGEYLGRVFDESKARPLYIVQDWCPPARTAGLSNSPEIARLPSATG